MIWNGNHFGNDIISTGIEGIFFHEICPNKAIVVGFGITKDIIKHFKNDVMGLVVGSQICTTIEKSIQNGQNSAAVESSTRLYKSLLNEVSS